MHSPFSILARHGYLLLFVWVLVDQLGIPLPATPVLLAGIFRMDWRRVVRHLSIARTRPEELRARLDADLETLPGALRMSPEEVSQRYHEIPREQEMILLGRQR